MSRNLSLRLDRLEQQLIPEDEPKVWEIVMVDSDGTTTPSGIRIEWPAPGSPQIHRRGAKVRQPWRRNR
jgi:hypothetical protein